MYNRVLLGHKIEWDLTIWTEWIDLGGIMLSEISQRKTNTIWFHLYVESKTQNKQNRNKHRYREQTYSCKVGGGWPAG